jgi:hypothetical protein
MHIRYCALCRLCYEPDKTTHLLGLYLTWEAGLFYTVDNMIFGPIQCTYSCQAVQRPTSEECDHDFIDHSNSKHQIVR